MFITRTDKGKRMIENIDTIRLLSEVDTKKVDDEYDDDAVTKSTAEDGTKRRRRRRRSKKSTATTSIAISTSSVSTIDSGNVSDGGSSSRTSEGEDEVIPPQHPPRRRPRKMTSTPAKQQLGLKLVVPDLSLQEQSQYIAMDCEMVGVGPEGKQSILARVTIVDWNYTILYDQYIQPTQPITDYRTFVSGITPVHLYNAIPYEQCQNEVQKLIHNKILIGHGLKNDLLALGINHPWYQIRDTTKYEPFMKKPQQQLKDDDSHSDSSSSSSTSTTLSIAPQILTARKLKDLCADKLGIEIQRIGQPHSPYEDSVSAMQLYQLVRTKWEKIITYKIQKTASYQQKKQ